MLTSTKGEINSNTVIVGDFNRAGGMEDAAAVKGEF